MHLETSSVKWWPFYLDLNVFTTSKVWDITWHKTSFMQNIDSCVLSIILFHMVCSVMLNKIRQQVIPFFPKGDINPHPTPPWASYQIRKISGCACAGNAGGVFPTRRLHRKPLVGDPDMHHGTCVTHVPWYMSESLTSWWRGKRSRHSRCMRTRNITYLARSSFPEW